MIYVNFVKKFRFKKLFIGLDATAFYTFFNNRIIPDYETDPNKSHVITDFIKMAKHEGVIKMRTDGTESRQFLYADDACEALLTLAKKYKKINKDKDYCITNFEWNKIYEIAEVLDVLSSCEIIPGDKKDDTQRNSMNEPNNNIKKYWEPKTSLKEGIMKLYNMY